MVTLSKQDMERLIILLSDKYGNCPESGFCRVIASSEEEKLTLILKSYSFNMPMLRNKNKTKPLVTKTFCHSTFLIKNLEVEIGEKLEIVKAVKNHFELSLKEAKDVVDAACTEKGVLVKSQDKCATLCEIFQKHGTYEIHSGEGQKTRISL